MLRIKTIFQSPPSGSGLNAYTVYNESDLASSMAGTLTISRPAVFLIDAFVRPKEPALPLVVVETLIKKEPFEIGNRAGRKTRVLAHVIGRMRGERDDLASFIADQIGASIPIYDFSSTQVFLEDALVEPTITIESVPTRRDDIRTEGSYDEWNIVEFAIQTIN